MKDLNLFWTITTFDGEVRNMTCNVERVAKEVMAIESFNLAEAEKNGVIYRLDKGLGNYLKVTAKYPNMSEREVLRILEPQAKWIDVDPMGQDLWAKYLVKSSIYDDKPEWYFESSNEAEYAYDEIGDELLLILEQENGKVKVITIEQR